MVTHVKLHHSKAASNALLFRIAGREEEIVSIQEPWLQGSKVCGLGVRDFNLLLKNGPGKIRLFLISVMK